MKQHLACALPKSSCLSLHQKRMRILVTGGAGFIGSHTLLALIKQGHEVACVDNFSNAEPFIPQRVMELAQSSFPVFETDVSTWGALDAVVQQWGHVDGIIHFAALKAVGESVAQPLQYYHNNLVSLLEVQRAMQKHQIPHLVFSSSCTVYGTPKQLPVNEKAPLQDAESPYGWTKRMGEQMLKDAVAANKGLKVCLLRYFNPIGAQPGGRIGELAKGVPNNLVPFITQTAIGLRQELKVFGNDYSTPDGTCIRDYIHVCDLADAHVAALEYLNQNTETMSIFNVGTGKGMSVLEAINAFERATGMELPYRFAPRRSGDVEKIWADPTKIMSTLGWKPKRSMEDAMRDAWRWEQTLAEERKS